MEAALSIRGSGPLPRRAEVYECRATDNHQATLQVNEEGEED